MFAKQFFLFSMGLVCLSQLPSSAAAQTFITSWGGYGDGDGQLKTPQGVAVGGSGEVYVSDGGNNRVEVFTSGGDYLRQWSIPDNHGSALNIAVDADDNVYVAVYRNALILKYTSLGTPVTQWGGRGSGSGQFFGYLGVAVDATGNVYVTDSENHRVQVFTPAGSLVGTWGSLGRGNGQFCYPDGLAVDASGNVYVADKANSRVQKFTNAGTYITQWGSPGTGDGQFSGDGDNTGPVRVGVGPEGNVYVVDHNLHRVQAFTSEGGFITKWGGYGAAMGQFNEPIGIAVDSFGAIYVADKNNSRIQKFGFAPTPAQSVTWGSMKVRYRGEPWAAQSATRSR